MGLSNTGCHVGYVIVDWDYTGYPSHIVLPSHGHVGHVKEYSMSEPTSAAHIHLANTFKTRVWLHSKSHTGGKPQKDL